MTASRSPAKIIPRAFPGIPPGEVAELIASSQLKNYTAGTILCHENALEKVFYLILEGEVEVTKVVNSTETRVMKTLGPGDFFGEMALIHNAPRAATVQAVAPLIVLEIDKDSFDRVLKHSSSVSLAMVREISRRLRENDEMAIDDLRIRAGELAEAYQKLAEQDLARREFLTNIAHQLRTPLTTANGYLQLLQKGAIPASEMSPIMDTVNRNIQQIMALVNDILFVQEMDLILGKFQPVDMLGMAKEIAEKYREPALKNNIPIRVHAKMDIPPIAGDPRHLERALTALLENAIKFSPNGGKVEINMQRDGDQIVITISDQGIGIAPDKLPLIFNRYYHLDRSGGQVFEGIGLGMAITNQVIKQHQGTLDVQSESGKGSTFTIRLNVWKDNGAAAEINPTKEAHSMI